MYPINSQRYGFTQPEKKDPYGYPYANVSFDSPEEQNPYQPQQAPEPQGPPDITEAYKELMTRQPGPAMTAYQKFLEGGYPDQNMKVGKATRLGAILSGAAAGFVRPGSGSEVANSVLSRPYEMAVHRYGMEGQRLREGAALEETKYGHDVAAFKAVDDAKNKAADNKRADDLAASLIKLRDINMQEAQQRMKNAGIHYQVNKNDGYLYMIKADGTNIPIGKFDESSGERIAEKHKEIDYTNQSMLDRQKKFDLFHVPLIEGSQKRVQDRTFAHADESREDTQQFQEHMEVVREDAREDLLKQRHQFKVEEDLKRAGLKNTTTVRNTYMANRLAVEALVAKDPEKYKSVWIKDPEGSGYDVLDKTKVGTPEYNAILSILYKDLEAKDPNNPRNTTTGAVQPKPASKFTVTRNPQ